MEQYANHVVSVKIRSYKAVEGILLDTTDNWLLLKYIPVDYVIDGVLIVNKRYVIGIKESQDQDLTEKVLRLKKVDFYEKSFVGTGSFRELYLYFLQSKQLVQISLADESVTYIGRVIKVNENSFRCQLVGVMGQWTNEVTFNYASVRMLGLHNDYVESLTLLVNAEK